MPKVNFPKPVIFDWDEGNRDKNYLKHGIPNEEAEQVFFNQPLLISKDEKHSLKEERYFCLGKTNATKTFFISFTIRKEKIRIISCRPMNRAERKIYEKAETNS